MATSDPSRGRRTGEAATVGATRWPYRVAICVFPEAASALKGLQQISAYGASVSDMAVIVPTPQAADALLSGDKDCPALFLSGHAPGEPEWQHMGAPASFTVRRLADVSDWASERTVATMRHDLSRGCVVLLVYGLRGMLQTLMADVLLHVAASRVEVHDIPPGHLAS
ncbi:hypothetical protein [Pelagibacterium halotolerans]|uniref:hypothetical protein n=1 Tax=Pelagibacterium halotolerans TaxID=531813 RepID=UPI00384B0C46